MNKVYISDYADPSSSAYKGLAAEIESEVLSMLQNRTETSSSGITGVKVTAFRNGSVLADMIVASKEISLSGTSIKDSVNNGIADGDLLSLGASGTVEVQGILSFIFSGFDSQFFVFYYLLII